MVAEAQTLIEQYDRAFAMLREIVDMIPEECWRAGSPRTEPARWAYHAVGSIDFYGNDTPDGPRTMTLNWEGDISALPGRAGLLESIETVRDKLNQNLARYMSEDFVAPTPFPWTGPTRLAQHVYALRHLTYHVGEMSMLLRLMGRSETPWH